jgi:hypothetical protein
MSEPEHDYDVCGYRLPPDVINMDEDAEMSETLDAKFVAEIVDSMKVRLFEAADCLKKQAVRIEALEAMLCASAPAKVSERMVAAGIEVLLQSGIVERQTRADALLVRDIFLAMVACEDRLAIYFKDGSIPA